jgi:hypothetical protein
MVMIMIINLNSLKLLNNLETATTRGGGGGG